MHLPQRSLAAFLYPSFISFVSAFESQFPIWFFFFLKRKKRKKKERKLQWSTGLSDLARITFLTPQKKKKKNRITLEKVSYAHHLLILFCCYLKEAMILLRLIFFFFYNFNYPFLCFKM